MIWKFLGIFKSKKVIIPVIIALVVGVAWWRFEGALRETGRQAQVILQQAQTIEDIATQLEKLEEQRNKEIILIEEYIEESREITREYRELHSDFQELKHEYEEIDDWSAQPIPDNLLDWMRGGTEDSDED